LPIYEQGHAIQKEQKRGLRDALANHGLVYEIDWQAEVASHGHTYMLNYMLDALEFWKPDVVLTQIHTPDPQLFNAEQIHKIRKEFPDFMWANWNGDYHPEDLLSAGNMAMVKNFDLQCVVTTSVREAYSGAGIPWMYWQIGYEYTNNLPGAYEGKVPHHDIVFLANGYSQERLRLARMLRDTEYDVGIYGSWGASIRANGSNLYNFVEGHKLYWNAQIAIGDNQWGDAAVGFVSNRLFQAMEGGRAALFHQYVPDLDKLLGLRDGEHYIVWTDLKDLRKKLDYWLDEHNWAKLRDIATAGGEFIRLHHSFNARVQELMEVLYP
jgi:hypothetical protein